MKAIIIAMIIQIATVSYCSHDTFKTACQEEGGEIVDLCIAEGGKTIEMHGYKACVQK